MLWELRLEDMPPRGAKLMGECDGCPYGEGNPRRRIAEIPLAPLIAKYGGLEWVKLLPPVRCTACGKRGLMTVRWPDPPYYRPEG